MVNQKIFLSKYFFSLPNFMTNTFVDYLRLQQALSELEVWFFLFSLFGEKTKIRRKLEPLSSEEGCTSMTYNINVGVY